MLACAGGARVLPSKRMLKAKGMTAIQTAHARTHARAHTHAHTHARVGDCRALGESAQKGSIGAVGTLGCIFPRFTCWSLFLFHVDLVEREIGGRELGGRERERCICVPKVAPVLTGNDLVNRLCLGFRA